VSALVGVKATVTPYRVSTGGFIQDHFLRNP